MTELETLERARMYLENLANCINPLDGTQVPDQELINNVRLSRCFFYVADVLQKVIKNGGTAPKEAKKKQPREPFFLTPEERSRFPFSESPISISVFAERVNALIDETHMTPIKATEITDWLLDAGLLSLVPTGEGRHVRRAAEAAASLGIDNEERMGQYGSYTGVFYQEKAQHFLLDNLDSILSFSKERIKNEGTPWSADENQLLRSLLEEGNPPEAIAARLQRKNASIKRQMKKLGL